MNIADNTAAPARIKPKGRIPIPGVDNSLYWLYFGKEDMEENESYLIELPFAEAINGGWPVAWVYTKAPSVELLEPDCVMLWGHETNKSFTACDPDTRMENLGFEFVATSSLFYFRSPETLEVVTVPIDASVVADFASGTVPKITVTSYPNNPYPSNARGYIGVGYFGGAHDFYIHMHTPSGSGRLVDIEETPATTAITNFTLGLGKPPRPRPGAHPSHYWRPCVVAMGNDI